jgi:diguanylate cyclase (GGDEF)-like protein
MLLAYSAISNSDQSALAGGWLAFGRRLSDSAPAGADWRLGLPFTIQPLSQSAASSTRVEWDGSAWVGRLALSPWPAALALRQPSAYDAQRDAVLRSLLIGTVSLMLLATAALALLLRQKVLLRLEKFAELAELSTNEAGESTRWPVTGSDELDALAGALNAMMERIERQEADLAYLASHDPLTDLGNRRQLMSSLRMATEARASEPSARDCLLLVDLDRFKSINDSLGHSAGDRVLSVVADRILSTIRQGDVVVRLGGDEFAVLLSGIRTEQVGSLCERLLARLAHAIPYEDRLLFTTASIGIAWVEAGVSEHELLRRADHAMYRAKQGGRNRVEHFQKALDG